MRRVIHAIATIACVLPLTACVTVEQIDAGVNTLKGQHYSTAFKRLGFPDQENKIAGYTVYSWMNQNAGSYTMPTYNTATSYVNGQTIYTQVQGSQTINYKNYCKLDLIVDGNGIVIDTKYDGNIEGCERYAALAPKKPSK